MKKLSHLKINRICSAHGPIWEKQVTRVEALYDRLSRYEAEDGVCIAYGSMYGNTAEAARNLAQELSSIGIPVTLHDLGTENISTSLRDIFRYNTLALGSPTYNGGIFPPVEAFLHAISARMVRGRNFIAFGSYSWAPASVRLMNDYAATHGFSILHPGISFPQAYSPEKCDMKTLTEVIRKALK
jgi:flavorubredoxin